VVVVVGAPQAPFVLLFMGINPSYEKNFAFKT
jgi:hypothetical protein